MKSPFLKGLNLLFAVALFAALNIQAMEQQEEGQEPISAQAQTDNVVERMYDAFSKQLEERFTESPTNFREAIAQLRCIAKLCEKSEITSPNAGEDFKITQNACEIKTTKFPHHMLHPIFKTWFNEACNKILLEHPKSVEAMDFILTRMSENISRNNGNKYYQATMINLPKIVTYSIQDQFIDMHGWRFDIKPYITFDHNGINSFKFVKSWDVYTGKNGIVSRKSTYNTPDGKQIFSKSSRFCGNLLSGLCAELHITPESNNIIKPLRALSDKEEASGCVLPPLWQKPTFQYALQKRVHENENKTQEKQQSTCIVS
jgi:hypothetical protein